MREEGLARDRRPLVTRWRSAQHPYATRAEHRVRRNASGSLLRLLFNDCSLQISDRCPTSWSDSTSQSRPPLLYYVCLHSERNSRKQRSENTLNLFNAWLLLAAMWSVGWPSEANSQDDTFGISTTFLFLLVGTAVLSKREDRFSRILEWTWLVIKNMYNRFKFTIVSLQDDSFDKMIGYWQLSTWLRARDSDSQTFASEVYCSKNYTGRYLLQRKMG